MSYSRNNNSDRTAPGTFTTATQTVLVVDQVTSTERITELGTEEAYLERERLVALVDSCVDDHGGVVDFACGDGAISRFASTGAALNAAWQVCGAAGGIAPDHSPVPARVRAAVHVAELLIDGEGRPFGLGLVVAVRSCAHAHPGGIVLSTQATSRLDRQTQRTVEWLGPVRLKGIPDDVCLWRSHPSARARIRRTEPSEVSAVPVAVGVGLGAGAVGS